MQIPQFIKSLLEENCLYERPLLQWKPLELTIKPAMLKDWFISAVYAAHCPVAVIAYHHPTMSTAHMITSIYPHECINMWIAVAVSSNSQAAVTCIVRHARASPQKYLIELYRFNGNRFTKSQTICKIDNASHVYWTSYKRYLVCYFVYRRSLASSLDKLKIQKFAVL